jgi:L-threonylcarbamoyladenylate synthase
MLFKISRLNPNQKTLKLAAKILRAGGIVAHPTDTCYGLAVDATNSCALKKLCHLKKITFPRAFTIIPPSRKWIKENLRITPLAKKFMRRFWPGALTLILAKKSGRGNLGVRLPDCKISLALAKLLKKPITTTSANLHGQKSAYSIRTILKLPVDLILDGGKLPQKKASLILNLTLPKPQMLRRGAVAFTRAVLQEIQPTRSPAV